jgi:hypothetical protein
MNRLTGILGAALLAPAGIFAQATPAAAPAGPVAGANQPKIGTMAPDFTLPGATRYGRLQNPVKLSDFRGETVVLAFFFQARTKG